VETKITKDTFVYEGQGCFLGNAHPVGTVTGGRPSHTVIRTAPTSTIAILTVAGLADRAIEAR